MNMPPVEVQNPAPPTQVVGGGVVADSRDWVKKHLFGIQRMREHINYAKLSLKCPCGLNYEESRKEPCLCPWAGIEDAESWLEELAPTRVAMFFRPATCRLDGGHGEGSGQTGNRQNGP